MAYDYTAAVLPLTWNFNANSYAMPAELRDGYSSPSIYGSGYSTPYSNTGYNNSYQQTNPFGNYSSIGMGGMFNNVLSLTNTADMFLNQNKDLFEISKQFSNYQMQQGFAQAQQIAVQRAQLMAQGINPNSVINGGQANSGNNGIMSLIQQLITGNTGQSSGTGNNMISTLMQLMGGLAGNKASTEEPDDYGLDALIQAIGDTEKTEEA